MNKKIISKIVLLLLFSLAINCINGYSYTESSANISITKLGELPTGGFAYDVKLKDDVAFIADLNAGLNIIDISNPNSPELIALYEMDSAYDVHISENLAYVTRGGNGFEVINITDLENPEQLGQIDGISMYNFDIEDDCAFIDSEGLLILNISDSLNPTEIYQYYDFGNISTVFVKENIAYLGTFILDSFMNFTIVDFSDKLDPQILGYYNTTDIVSGIRVIDDIALVANWGNGLLIFNVSNPEDPTVLSNYDDSGFANMACFVDEYAFVADYSYGLEILNIKDPANPTEIAQFFDGGHAYAIAVKNNLAYIADGDNGLEILEINGLFPTEKADGFNIISVVIVLDIIILLRLIKKKKRLM
ncbi:MAG: hypothetical protein FK730_14545 [Asgard group archaeon]|nr:hypothetical protein [Asgard group archaeon]